MHRKGESEEEDLSTCSVQEEHAKKLAEALKVNNKLTKLDLYDNELGDEGLKVGKRAGCCRPRYHHERRK